MMEKTRETKDFRISLSTVAGLVGSTQKVICWGRKNEKRRKKYSVFLLRKKLNERRIIKLNCARRTEKKLNKEKIFK